MTKQQTPRPEKALVIRTGLKAGQLGPVVTTGHEGTRWHPGLNYGTYSTYGSSHAPAIMEP